MLENRFRRRPSFIMSNETPPPQPTPSALGDTSPAGPDSHLFDRLSVLYKYRWASLTVFALVVGWVMVDSYTRIPVYRAQARVLIEDPSTDIATPSEINRNTTPADPEIYMQTQLRIMRGRDLAARVAAKLEMARIAEFNGQGPKPTQLAVAIALVKYYAVWPYRLITSTTSEPPPPLAGLDVADTSSYPEALLARQGVTQIRGSQLVDLTFNAADPAFAARAANAFADEFVSSNLAYKVSTIEKSADWLTGEVQKQAELVKQSEMALAQYKESEDAGSLDSNQNIILARLTQSNEAVTKARLERIQKEGLWRQLQDAGTDVDSISSVLNNTYIQSLRASVNTLQQERARASERYGEKHPDYQKAVTALANAERTLDGDIRKAVQNAKNEFDAAVTQERELQRQLNESKVAATELGRKGVNYAVLSREAESNRTVYNQLLTREKELRVVANSRTNNVRVVDRAEIPTVPFAPNHRRDWVYAIALGLALGLGIAFGIDYLDDTVKTPDDITRRLRLKFLGLVPIVGGERHPLISGPVPHDFGEAYRAIRTSLAAQFTHDGPRVVAVASSQPLEGKTTTAVNIAMALAVGGARVLLIDADMRRPSVHKALRMTNDRGLSQLLAGQARMREVVQRTHDPNLLTITAGRTPANPSELLASDRMRALLTGLETGPFDWIIIDTPPVLAVTDAVILAPLVGAVAFVIGAEMTRWRLAERAVETLLGSNPRQVLAVLNKVNFGRNKYYYSRYYGHQYKNYYAESPAA
jgi:capsular exopolysaccharide synthesis family protein